MPYISLIDLFVSWTPLAVAMLLLLILFVGISGILIYVHRVIVCAWFDVRWVEQSSARARTIALWTTGYYVGSRLGIPGIDPVSLNLCLIGWARSIWKFVQPDTAPTSAPGTATGPSLAIVACLVLMSMAALSACTSTQQQTACNLDKLAPAIVVAGTQIAEQANPGSTQDAELAKTIDITAHAAAQAACAALVAPPAATATP